MTRRLIAILLGLIVLWGESHAQAPDRLVREVAVPRNEPLVIVGLPTTWKVEDIDFGISALSPDKSVKIFVESAKGASTDALLATNDAWMKSRGINTKGKPDEAEATVSGMPGKFFRYSATDEWGDTNLVFVVVRTQGDRVLLLTLWGSNEEQKANGADIERIMNSVRRAK